MLHKTLIAVSMLFLLTGVAHAQFSNAPDPVQYIVSPETPGPNQKVFIEVQGLGSFLGNSTITWQENGRTVSSGVGTRTFSFTTGGVGSVSHIKATISTPREGSMVRDFYFAPSVVYLTWEADTSVPFFYKGKSLYSAGSPLKVVALPFVMSGTSLVPIERLSFQWSRKGDPVPEQSGSGKNVFSFTGDQLQLVEEVSVNVLLQDRKVGYAEIRIPAVEPQVLLYSRDPLRGALTEKALPVNFSLGGNEVTLQAEPYFFSNKAVSAGKLTYSWTLNGRETAGPESAKGLLTLRQTGQGSGEAVIGVEVQNTDDTSFVQVARQALQITFGQSGNAISNFLGL